MRKILFATLIIGLLVLPHIIKNPFRPNHPNPQIERVVRIAR